MRRVNPVEARKGDFLRSFPVSQLAEMLDYCAKTEAAAKRNSLRGEVVYTKIARWGKGKGNDTWQVFFLRK